MVVIVFVFMLHVLFKTLIAGLLRRPISSARGRRCDSEAQPSSIRPQLRAFGAQSDGSTSIRKAISLVDLDETRSTHAGVFAIVRDFDFDLLELKIWCVTLSICDRRAVCA
ncbi:MULTISPECIES: hypothetical protein [Bradyrhizobium]